MTRSEVIYVFFLDLGAVYVGVFTLKIHPNDCLFLAYMLGHKIYKNNTSNSNKTQKEQKLGVTWWPGMGWGDCHVQSAWPQGSSFLDVGFSKKNFFSKFFLFFQSKLYVQRGTQTQG